MILYRGNIDCWKWKWFNEHKYFTKEEDAREWLKQRKGWCKKHTQPKKYILYRVEIVCDLTREEVILGMLNPGAVRMHLKSRILEES